MNFINACRKFISIDSTSLNGTLEAARWIGQYCEARGFQVEYLEDSIGGVPQANVLIRPQGLKGQEELMLQSHIDTVDPGSFSAWTKTQENPFNATIYNNAIYGVGTAQAKLDLLCKIRAAESLQSTIKKPFVIAATYAQEMAMAGAIKLIRRKAVNAKRALIGEPTELRLGHSGPGIMVVEAMVPFSEEEKLFREEHDLTESSSSQSKFFAGRAAHSSHPGLGENAIIKMLEYLGHLPAGIAVLDMDGGIGYSSVPSSAVLEFDMVGNLHETVVPKLVAIVATMKSVEEQFLRYSDPGFSPPHSTLNLGSVRTYKDHIKLVGSCRWLPSVPEDVARGWIEKIRQTCLEQKSEFHIADLKPPFRTPAESDFVTNCQESLKHLGLDPTLGKISSCTEASVFGRLGIECLVFGPGQGVGNSHAPNEHVQLQDLESATEFYKRLIERHCV